MLTSSGIIPTLAFAVPHQRPVMLATWLLAAALTLGPTRKQAEVAAVNQ